MTHRRPPDPDALMEHAAFVRHVARAALRGDDLVDDVVQDTMLAALQAEAPPRGPLRNWLAGIARNRARNLVRQRAATRSREARARPGEPGRAVDDVVARAEVGRRVAAAVVSLDEPYRRALLLRYFDGLPPRDMARELGVPVETARTHVKRGLAQLRTRLESTHVDAPGGWRAALLPLASSPLGPAGTTTAASVGGIVMGKKALAIGAALAALVGAGVWLGPWDEKEVDRRLEVDAGPLPGDAVSTPSLVGQRRAAAASITTQAPAPTGFAHLDVEVIDVAGHAVPGVAVRLQTWDRSLVHSYMIGAYRELVSDPEELRGRDIGRAMTDAEGRARFARLDPTVEYRVVANPAPPFTSAAARGTAGDGDASVVRLRLLRGAPLGIRVVGPAGQRGQAVVDLRLAASHEDPAATWSSGPRWTDADGRLQLPSVPAGTLRADALLPGVARRTGVLFRTPAGEEVTIELSASPGAELHGFVRDGDGRPVDGATLIAHAGARHAAESLVVLTTTSAADGSYRITGLPAGSLRGIECAAAGLVGPSPGTLARQLLPDDVVEQDVVMLPACRIHGRVRTPDGEPVPGAYVDLTLHPAVLHGSWQLRAACAEDGSFELGPLPAGRAQLAPRASGFVAAACKTEVVLAKPGDAAHADLVLQQGTPLTGRVLGPQGAGVAGATLHLRGPYSLWDTYPPFEAVATDAEGRFRFPGLPTAELYEVGLHVGSAHAVHQLRAGSPNELRVPRMAEIHGRVVWVGATPAGRSDVIANLPPQSHGTSIVKVELSATIEPDATFVVRGLEAVPVELSVRDCYRQPAGPVVRRDLEEGQVVQDVELRAGPFLEISGAVVDERGKPRAGVRVVLTAVGDPGLTTSQVADTEGQFRFVRVPEGKHRVAVERSVAFVEVQADAADLRLVATDERRIVRGTIAFADGELALRGTILREEVVSANRTTSHAILIHAGAFEFQAPDGAEIVQLRVNQIFDAKGHMIGFRPWRAAKRVDEPLHIVLQRLETVEARVVDESGQGLPGVRVLVWPHPHRGTMPYDLTSDSDGVIPLAGLERDQLVDLSVQAVPAGFAVPLTITPKVGDDEIRIVVPRGGAVVRGHVLDSSEAPVPGIHVFGVFGRAHAGTTTDEHGAFTLEGLPPDCVGHLGVRPRPEQPYGSTRLDNVRTGARDVVLHLPSHDVLRGRVGGDVSEDAELRFIRRGSDSTKVPIAGDGTFQAAVSGEGRGTLLLLDTTANRYGLLEDVTPGVRDVVIPMRGGAVIEGRLEGEFVPETTYVLAQRGQVSSGARVEQDGTFRIAALPPGAYTVEAWNGSGQPTRLGVQEGVVAGTVGLRLAVGGDE